MHLLYILPWWPKHGIQGMETLADWGGEKAGTYRLCGAAPACLAGLLLEMWQEPGPDPVLCFSSNYLISWLTFLLCLAAGLYSGASS